MATTVSVDRGESVDDAFNVDLVVDDMAGLSSEALSHMMRESRIAIGYQCDDEWIIEQVRHRLGYFVTHCERTPASLEAAWQAYVMNFYAVRDSWKCSFAGSTDYAWGKVGFEVRSHANSDMGWADGHFDSGIMTQPGCVFRRNSMSDGYPPPAEVIAAFPGYTPLTATFDWVADPGCFPGKRVENWQYVCHPDFEPPRPGKSGMAASPLTWLWITTALTTNATSSPIERRGTARGGGLDGNAIRVAFIRCGLNLY